jgi:hypothetical protein
LRTLAATPGSDMSRLLARRLDDQAAYRGGGALASATA